MMYVASMMDLQLVLALFINHELEVNGTATVLTIVLDVLRPTGKLKVFVLFLDFSLRNHSTHALHSMLIKTPAKKCLFD